MKGTLVETPWCIILGNPMQHTPNLQSVIFRNVSVFSVCTLQQSHWNGSSWAKATRKWSGQLHLKTGHCVWWCLPCTPSSPQVWVEHGRGCGHIFAVSKITLCRWDWCSGPEVAAWEEGSSLGVCTGWIFFNSLPIRDSSGAENASNNGENSRTASSCRDVWTRSS